MRRKRVRDGWERALKSRARWVGIPIMGRSLLVPGNPGLSSLLVSDDQAPCSDQNQRGNLCDLGQQESAATPLSNTSLQSLVRLLEEVSSDAWLSISNLPRSSLVRGTCEIEETAFY